MTLEADASFFEAQTEDPQEERAGLESLIVFQLGGEQFAFAIAEVAEVRAPLPISSLPAGRLPAWVLGLVNLRGAILAVIDLGMRLGLTEPAAGADSGMLIVVRGPGYSVALRVDEIAGLKRAPRADFRPTPAGASQAAQTYVEQVVLIDGRLVAQLSLPRVLADAGRTPNDG